VAGICPKRDINCRLIIAKNNKTMILILSYTTIYEQGTDPVLDWLIHYRVKFMRLSVYDIITKKIDYEVDVENKDIIINGISVRDNISVIWNRRLWGEHQKILDGFSGQLKQEVEEEITDFVKYLSYLLSDKKWLTPFDKRGVNKLEVINLAMECGLNCPRTIVVNNKRSLWDFFYSCDRRVITKPISDCREGYNHEGFTYVVFTTSMDEAKIQGLPERFFPTLFQEKVSIDFEIRVFFLGGQFSATAIINTASKSVDRKLDNQEKTTHFVPYQLPKTVEEAIIKLMNKLDLDIGSLDIIKTTTDQYYFLEVNPVGQYLSESEKCNFNIDQQIAHWLISHENAENLSVL
jgi:hypothetical protein